MEWFLLVVTIEGSVFAQLPIKGGDKCGDALPAIHALMSMDHTDVVAQCVGTSTATVRPRARPARG